MCQNGHLLTPRVVGALTRTHPVPFGAWDDEERALDPDTEPTLPLQSPTDRKSGVPAPIPPVPALGSYPSGLVHLYTVPTGPVPIPLGPYPGRGRRVHGDGVPTRLRRTPLASTATGSRLVLTEVARSVVTRAPETAPDTHGLPTVSVLHSWDEPRHPMEPLGPRTPWDCPAQGVSRWTTRYVRTERHDNGGVRGDRGREGQRLNTVCDQDPDQKGSSRGTPSGPGDETPTHN